MWKWFALTFGFGYLISIDHLWRRDHRWPAPGQPGLCVVVHLHRRELHWGLYGGGLLSYSTPEQWCKVRPSALSLSLYLYRFVSPIFSLVHHFYNTESQSAWEIWLKSTTGRFLFSEIQEKNWNLALFAIISAGLEFPIFGLRLRDYFVL